MPADDFSTDALKNVAGAANYFGVANKNIPKTIRGRAPGWHAASWGSPVVQTPVSIVDHYDLAFSQAIMIGPA